MAFNVAFTMGNIGLMKNKERFLVHAMFSLAIIIAAAFALTFLGACGGGAGGSRTQVTKSVSTLRMSQSHFTFPNSNVIPLGTGKGTAKVHGDIYNFPDVGSATTNAMEQAIKSKGGDLMINVMINTVTTTTTVISGGDFSISFDVDITVQGTVAKMEVGKQMLK